MFDTFTDPEPGAPAVRASAELLSGAVGAYGYVSGMSVYAPSGPSRPDESGPVRQAGVEPDADRLQERSLAKLAGEAAVSELFDGRRCSRGSASWSGRGRPASPTGRCGSPARRRAGCRIDPGAGRPPPQRPVLRRPRHRGLVHLDACGGTRRHLQHGRSRPAGYLVVGDRGVLHRGGCRAGRSRLLRHADEDLLRDRLSEVDEEERPLWYPEDQIPQEAIESSAAQAAGLRFRPAAMTAADTLHWAEGAGEPALTDSFLPTSKRSRWSARAPRAIRWVTACLPNPDRLHAVRRLPCRR